MDEWWVEPLGLLGAGVVLLRLFLPRALLCLRPQAVRCEVELPAEALVVPGSLEAAWGELRGAGFVPLGAHSEVAPLAAPVLHLDAVHPAHGAVASVSAGPDGEARVLLLSRAARGFVLTADHRRPAREVPGVYLSGSVEGASAERLLKAHLRRVAELGPGAPFTTLEERVEAARAWHAGVGKPELRQQHAVALLWTLGALGMVGAALHRFLW